LLRRLVLLVNCSLSRELRSRGRYINVAKGIIFVRIETWCLFGYLESGLLQCYTETVMTDIAFCVLVMTPRSRKR
jgi:hypothetical protein